MKFVHFNNLYKILACLFLFLISFSLQANQLDENEVGRIISRGAVVNGNIKDMKLLEKEFSDRLLE